MTKTISELCTEAHSNAVTKGFYEDGKARNKGERIALMHSELSELLEAERTVPRTSEKIPEYTLAEEEAADVLIRMFDYCAFQGYDLEGAVLAKMAYNSTRPKMHGGKKF